MVGKTRYVVERTFGGIKKLGVAKHKGIEKMGYQRHYNNGLQPICSPGLVRARN